MDAAPLDPSDAEPAFGPDDDVVAGVVPELEVFEPADSLSAIAGFLGVDDPGELIVVTEVLDDRNLFPTGAALLDVLLAADAVLEGIEGFGPPRWFPFDPRDASSTVPLMGWFGVDAGATVGGVGGPLALRIGLGPLGTTLEVIGTADDPSAPADALAALSDLRRSAHPLRGKVVRVSGAAGNLSYRLVPPHGAGRERLVLPAGVWAVLDQHVHGFLAAGDRLAALGMGMHIGVLVVGAAGTGKTALCRALAEELRDEATTLLVDPVTARDSLAELYALASLLAPTLVVIEHVEGAGPTRGTDAPLALAQFLTALDLADDALGPVVTVFTTGEVSAVDASVRVGGRLHSTVELPVPDLRARRAILDALLDAASAALGPDALDALDVAALARATDGATGADLHHLVRLALVGADGPVTTAALLARARAGGWAGADPGLYL